MKEESTVPFTEVRPMKANNSKQRCPALVLKNRLNHFHFVQLCESDPSMLHRPTQQQKS